MSIYRIWLPYLVCITIFIGNIQALEQAKSVQVGYQTKQGSQEKLVKFYTPVKATSEGINNFLRYIYNDPEYAQDYLPNDFSHLYQLLHTKQSRAYAQSVLRLFSNKLKASNYVNAHAFCYLLEQLPTLLEPYFIIQRTADFDSMQKKINNLLHARFLAKFAEFKSNPTLFFDDLSGEIVDALATNSNNASDITIEELRKTALIFLEVGLGKLIWCPTDSLDTWKSIKTISDHLMKLSDVNIIVDTDDLNDLFVTLLERYCYFLDVAALDMPLEFYTTVNQEVEKANLAFLTHAEQESMLETKKQRFKRALAVGEVKNRAQHQGIITA